MNRDSREITDEFLAQLKEDLVCRRVGRGMTRLQDHQYFFLHSILNKRMRRALQDTWRNG